MRTSGASNVVLVGLVAGLAFVSSCSYGGVVGVKATGAGGGTGGLAGSATGSGGMAGSTGSIAGASGSGTAGAGGTGTAGPTDAPGSDGTGGGNDITKIVPTIGCGNDPGQTVGTFVMDTIETMGTKAADCFDSKCGAWSYTRQYSVRLPTGYDNTKAYPLIFEGAGCGSTGSDNLYALPDLASAAIRVGWSASVEAQAFHATNPGQGCFDWADGDNSVEWAFYEDLYDRLAVQLCFDRNRVFAAGNAGGAMLASELGCKYAGDPTRPIRGVVANDGGLTAPQYLPTCTTTPTAGLWANQRGATHRPFTQAMAAIARAMKVNGCTIGTGFLDAQFDSFPIGGGNPDTTCQMIKGCPALYPLVVCALPGNSDSSNDAIANPGFSTFLELFSAAPLLTP
jgi:hypothetical protein